MPSDTASGPLRDIKRNIELAFVTGLSYDDFSRDRRTVYAVIRCLEIISEATRKLPETLKARHPQLPWPDIAGAGNVYRHDYEDVLDKIVWRTVQQSLAPLAEAVRNELDRITP